MKTSPDIQLSGVERQTLQTLIRKGSSSARVQTRARILLLAAESKLRKTNANQTIADVLQVSARTVSRVRQRFVQGGLELALYDRPRAGRPVEIDGEAEAKLVMLACSDPPVGRQRWTLQLLADRMVALGYVDHISDTWVGERLKKTNCIPG